MLYQDFLNDANLATPGSRLHMLRSRSVRLDV